MYLTGWCKESKEIMRAKNIDTVLSSYPNVANPLPESQSTEHMFRREGSYWKEAVFLW
jgi:hypothetical protein